MALTRAKFEELCLDLLDQLLVPVENFLRDAKLGFKDLDEVIVVGVPTRIPAVKSLTGKDPNVTVILMKLLLLVLQFRLVCSLDAVAMFKRVRILQGTQVLVPGVGDNTPASFSQSTEYWLL